MSIFVISQFTIKNKHHRALRTANNDNLGWHNFQIHSDVNTRDSQIEAKSKRKQNRKSCVISSHKFRKFSAGASRLEHVMSALSLPRINRIIFKSIFRKTYVNFNLFIVLGDHLGWAWNRRKRSLPWWQWFAVGTNWSLLQWSKRQSLRATCGARRLGTRNNGRSSLIAIWSTFPPRQLRLRSIWSR